jgi:hypothetical protein
MEQLEVSLQPPAATLSERLAETKIPCVRARHQADGMGPDRVPRVIRHMQPDTKILLQGRRSAWHNFFAAGTLGYMGVSSGRLGIPFVNPATIMFKPRCVHPLTLYKYGVPHRSCTNLRAVCACSGQVAALGALTYGLGGMALATLSGKPL